MYFHILGYFGGMNDSFEAAHLEAVKNDRTSDITVQCFTLSSLLNALNVTHIDYFSLDVEGAELEILQTVPLDKITVDTLSIEYRQWDGHEIRKAESIEKLNQIRDFFGQFGDYKEAGILPWGTDENIQNDEGLGLDVIFQRIA